MGGKRVRAVSRTSAVTFLFAAAALALAAAHLLNLLGSAYAAYAESHLDRATDAGVLQASRLASKLTPWSPRRQALAGWILGEHEAYLDSEAAYRSALRWAPADALLWAEHSQVLARAGRFDAALHHAVRRAQVLAPSSFAVHTALAAVGLAYWRRADATLREALLVSMRYHRDHDREGFLYTAAIRGQALTFCADAALRLGESDWCADVKARGARCGRHEDVRGYALCMAQ